jgi:hypothetical protein
MSLLKALTTTQVYKKTETLLKVAINMGLLNTTLPTAKEW